MWPIPRHPEDVLPDSPAERRGVRKLALIGGLVLVFVIALLLGRLSAPSSAPIPAPILRYGPATLGPNQDALVVASGQLIQDAVVIALNDAKLPVALDQVQTSWDESGLHLSARAGVDVLGVPVRGTLRTVMVPHAQPDGTVGVSLTDTHAVGVKLPGGLQDAIQSAVNDQITKATRLPGYRVQQVEIAKDAMYVYLALDRSALQGALKRNP